MNWIDFNKSFAEFVKLKRNVSGCLMEIRDGDKPPYKRRAVLIGDVNSSGSAEEGGKPFSDEAIVLRYQYIWGHWNDGTELRSGNRITHQDKP